MSLRHRVPRVLAATVPLVVCPACQRPGVLADVPIGAEGFRLTVVDHELTPGGLAVGCALGAPWRVRHIAPKE